MEMKLKYSLLLCIILIYSCEDRSSENFEPEAEGITFVKKIGGNNPDIGRSIRKAGTGYIISGWTESKGAGLRDMWLVKTNSLGEIDWDQTYGDHNNDWGYFANQTNDNGFILSGRTSTGNVQGASTGLVPSIMVAKTDSLGNELWRSLLGSNQNSRIAYQVLETPDNGYIVLASHNRSNHFAVFEGAPYIVLYKLNSIGNQLWNYTYKDWSEGLSASISEDGSIVVVGTQITPADPDDLEPEQFSNILAIKVSSSGQLLWEKEFNYSVWDIANSVKKINNGYILTGQIGNYKSSDLDMFILRMDESGNEIWHQTIGGNFSDRGNDIIETSFGEFVVAGTTFSYDSGNGDFWLVKYTASGELLWSKAIGGDQLDFAYSIVEADDYGYVIVGETESYRSILTDILMIKTDRHGRVKRNNAGEIVADN